jgi:hypothetical protein
LPLVSLPSCIAFISRSTLLLDAGLYFLPALFFAGCLAGLFVPLDLLADFFVAGFAGTFLAAVFFAGVFADDFSTGFVAGAFLVAMGESSTL